MCCLVAIMGVLGPRVAIVVWWLFEPLRWTAAFHANYLWPVLGFFLLPWTTLMWVLIAPTGNLTGIGWLFLAIAVVIDVADWSLGGFGNRRRFQRGAPSGV